MEILGSITSQHLLLFQLQQACMCMEEAIQEINVCEYTQWNAAKCTHTAVCTSSTVRYLNSQIHSNQQNH